MNFNRRTFIKSSSVLLGSVLLQGNRNLDSLILENEGKLKSIRNSVGVFTEKGGTIGWYAQGETIVVIDSQFPDSAKKFKNELNSKSTNRINFLFNTHHHRDHTQGNFYLKDFAENIVAHKNCPRLQIKQNKGKDTESMVVTANITFQKEMKFTLPKENINTMYFGNAHTGGDIVIHFENANVVHLGDLVFNNVYPYIDNTAECSVENWVKVLDQILNYFDSDTKFIFGHADDNKSVIGNKHDIIKKRNYLDALQTYVTKLKQKGLSIDVIAKTNTIPGFDDINEKWDGARMMNLKAAAEQIIK